MVDATAPEWPREQIASQLRQRISAGQITGRLPSIPDLAAEYQCSPMTVQRALDILKDEGVIYSVPGRGTFVTG